MKNVNWSTVAAIGAILLTFFINDKLFFYQRLLES